MAARGRARDRRPGPDRRPLHPRPRAGRRGGRRPRRRLPRGRPGARDADQARPSRGRAGVRRATPPRTSPRRGSPSAGSTPRTSAGWSRAARRGSSSCARSPTPPIPRRPHGRCAPRLEVPVGDAPSSARRSGPGRRSARRGLGARRAPGHDDDRCPRARARASATPSARPARPLAPGERPARAHRRRRPRGGDRGRQPRAPRRRAGTCAAATPPPRACSSSRGSCSRPPPGCGSAATGRCSASRRCSASASPRRPEPARRVQRDRHRAVPGHHRGGGFLFWKLVRVMARIQVASRRPASPSARLEPPHARERLRLHRHRFRPGWIRRRHPRGPARHEDRHRGEGPDRRPVPELRVHPRQGRAAGRRHRLRDRRGVRVRHHGPGAHRSTSPPSASGA